MSQTPPVAPAVRIVEQPASKALRFRYECEGRSAGSIPGCNSTAEKKTYPTIEITGHKGKAIVVVSCVTKEEPFRPHPHNLVGRADRCNKGVCTMTPNVAESPLVSFANLGIQCVKRKDVADALNTREKLNVDPFKTGFGHKNQPQSIDLNAVRLCFQVFLPDRTGKYRHSLPPQVSDVIYDKKAMSDLLIMRVSCCSGTVRGGTEVILLCEKVTREDIAVVVFQKEKDVVVWEESANVILVHKLVAIACTTPPYRNPHAREHVQVFLQLKRLSDNARSAPVPFEYIPESAESEYLKTKRRKTLSPCSAYEQDRGFMPEIKAEPRDKTPPHVVSPPLRMFPPDPAADPYQQRWLMPMDNMTMNMPQTCQPMNWPPPSYPSPAIQIPNMQQMSPNMQQMSPAIQIPNMQQMSPNMQQMSPNMQQISPNMQQMNQNMQNMHRLSPNMQQVPGSIPQSISPGHNMVQSLSPGHMGSLSPGHNMGQPLSPGHHIGQALSPGHHIGQALSPGHNMGQALSPGHNIGQVMPPGHMGQVLSPGHNMGQAMSPGHNMGQAMSPGHNMGQAMSPGHNMGQAMSPGHNMGQEMSPAHNMGQAMSPGHNMGQVMSPGHNMGQMTMDQMRQNMGHISPNLVQQNMNQEVGGDMEVVNECATLSALLREGGGDAAMLTSADLSQLLGLGRNTSELSNSLKELSTNDLLK